MAGSSTEKQMIQNRSKRLRSPLLGVLIAATIFPLLQVSATAARLDEMSLDRWKKLREVERYQLQIAEKYYREKNWKVAMSEYEKYLTLYERSEAAGYSQLKWSICLVRLRKLNTAVKEGFQSVIDYWPDSSEAVAAAYYIGSTYKNMGEIKKAKKAYRNVLTKFPKHLVAVYTMWDLIDVANVEGDGDTRVSLWKNLTFETKRTRESRRYCADSSRSLAMHYFYAVAFGEGVKSLETTYNENDMPYHVQEFSRRQIRSLVGNSKTKAKGEKLADLTLAYVRTNLPKDTSQPEQKKRAQTFWYYLTDIHSDARRDAKVLETYDQIKKIFGVDDGLLGRLAGWYKSRNRYEDARRTYGQYKNKVEGLNQIAYSYRQQNKYEPAVLAYRRALVIDADGIIRWNSQIASTYRDAKKYKEAIAVYEELYKLDAEHAQDWRWNIATAYRDAGLNKDAIGHFRQCTNFPSNYVEMARCHRRLKQYGEAILLYNQIIGGHAQSAPWGILQIGYTREEAGDKEKAIRAFQQVCKRFPKNSHASVAHARLQSKYKINVTLGGAKDQ